MTPARLRQLAMHLETRMGAPSLEGYSLVEGLYAAADLMAGGPGPFVHADEAAFNDMALRHVRRPLSELEANLVVQRRTA